MSSGATADGKPLNLNVLAEAIAIFAASICASGSLTPSLRNPSAVIWISPLKAG